MFIAPEMKHRYPDWENEARGILESFRATYDFWSHAAEFNSLVEELRALSPQFQRWWKEHGVRLTPSGEKLMRHPRLSKIGVNFATFQFNQNPDLRLVLYGHPSKARERPI
jgi:hypothetical protein